MPYVNDEARERLQPIESINPESVGELNYCITLLMDNYLYNRVSYLNINSAIGVLECAKLELYRRIAAPYEDTKIIENGDVYLSRRKSQANPQATKV